MLWVHIVDCLVHIKPHEGDVFVVMKCKYFKKLNISQFVLKLYQAVFLGFSFTAEPPLEIILIKPF